MADVRGRTDDRAGYPPRRLTALVLAVGALALGAAGIGAIGETSGRAALATEPVTAIVVDERVDERLVADRRGSRLVPFRIVGVELPDGSLAEVRSDTLAVGSTATVYVGGPGTAFETPPEPPGPLEWTVGAAAIAGGVTLMTGSALALRRSRRP
ncbi:hypothetical protein [Agromyces sp. SYSU T0242]|uniref:hypothetical protein n=1 Tax=Agromyces litoreus TaxID=3158561 RepID=UPI003396D523